MKKRIFSNKAFTLIEILVVVLIIGILAAIALPKYQLSVGKTKYANLKTLTRSVYQSVLSYKLATNEFPPSFDVLDIKVPTNSGKELYCAYYTPEQYVHCKNNKIQISYILYTGSGKQACVTYNDNTIPNKICQEETDKPYKSNHYYLYPSKIH